MRHALSTFAVVSCSLLATLATAADTVELDPQAQARAGIVVRPVLERTFGDQFRIVGQVVRAPGSSLVLKTVVAGRVEGLEVAPGDAVAAGDPLVILHSHELQTLQATLLRGEKAARLANLRVDAGRQLLEVQGISQLELEAREEAALDAKLALASSKAELIDVGLTAGEVDALLESGTTDPHLAVRAPASGVVLELPVHEHEWIQAYDPLVTLGDPQRLELELQVPPDQVNRVSRGDVVEFIPVGRTDTRETATVLTSVPEVDAATRTLTIRAAIDPAAEETLYPGVFVEGTLTHGDPRSAPSVPESAVIRVGSNDVVFVQTGPSTFVARPVGLGLFNGTRYEVREGVSVGEEVAVQGVFFLKSALVTGEGEE
jgi:cobalt-zinc-cadmium efflux system membrane fusion protein